MLFRLPILHFSINFFSFWRFSSNSPISFCSPPHRAPAAASEIRRDGVTVARVANSQMMAGFFWSEGKFNSCELPFTFSKIKFFFLLFFTTFYIIINALFFSQRDPKFTVPMSSDSNLCLPCQWTHQDCKKMLIVPTNSSESQSSFLTFRGALIPLPGMWWHQDTNTKSNKQQF